MREPPYYVRNRTVESMSIAILRLVRAMRGPPDLSLDVLDTLADQDLAKLIADAQALVERRKRPREYVTVIEVDNLLPRGPRRRSKPKPP
jgi:hypothetical protein